MASIQGFHHIMLKAADLDATVRFYTQVLDFKVEFSFTGGAMLVADDGVHLEVMAGGQPFSATQGFAHIALATDDVDAVLDKVRAYGQPVTVEPRDHTFDCQPAVRVRLAFFTGPSDETVELFHVYP